MKKQIETSAFMTAVKETLDSGYEVDFTVTGNSMWPLLSHGRDRVIIKKCTPNELKKGDIILFEPIPEKYILHRIIKIDSNTFTTAGDGNCFNDGVYEFDKVIGKVIEIVRKDKKQSANKYAFIAKCWISLFPIRKPILKFLIKIKKPKAI